MKWKAENGDTTWYDYDLLGNLRSVQQPDGTCIQYLIDGQNRRVAKIINGKIKKKWLYQNQLNIITELDSVDNLESRFVYGSKDHVTDYMMKNGITYRFITDHLGSVRFVVDVASDTVVQYFAYDEFGNILTDTNPGFQPFGYAGGLYDMNAGLVRFGARDYNAEYGRWTAKDPIGFNGDQSNVYIYVNNNPINSMDTQGLGIDDVWSDMSNSLNGPVLITDMSENTTTLYTYMDEEPTRIETRVVLDSRSQPGAGDPFETTDVNPINNLRFPRFGPEGAFIDTGDPRERDIHGGGTGLHNPYVPRQGWVATYGCTRGQNEDVQKLNQKISKLKSEKGGLKIPYKRRY